MVASGTPLEPAQASRSSARSRGSTSSQPVAARWTRSSAALPSRSSTAQSASRKAASPPGRIGTCSSASRAVFERRGSTTTTRPPRARMARSRPRAFGAVMTLPFETTGFAPTQRKYCVRSMSGTGMTSELP